MGCSIISAKANSNFMLIVFIWLPVSGAMIYNCHLRKDFVVCLKDLHFIHDTVLVQHALVRAVSVPCHNFCRRGKKYWSLVARRRAYKSSSMSFFPWLTNMKAESKDTLIYLVWFIVLVSLGVLLILIAAFFVVRFNTNQFSRSFIPAVTRLWNDLPNHVVVCAASEF